MAKGFCYTIIPSSAKTGRAWVCGAPTDYRCKKPPHRWVCENHLFEAEGAGLNPRLVLTDTEFWAESESMIPA